MPHPSTPARQRGAAMLEFAAAALPLLFAGAAAVEAARWFAARQVAALALHEAARAAAAGHGEPGVLRQAFEQALRPLFVPPGAHGTARARMQAAAARLRSRAGLAPWRIELLGPPAAAHADFARPGLGPGGAPAIGNDYLAEQHRAALARGWPGGRGPASGLTIHEASVLHLRLVYLHEPLVPGMAALLRVLAPSPDGAAGSGQTACPASRDYAAQAWAAGLLPIALEARMTMQSHLARWPMECNRIGPPPAGPDEAGGGLPPIGWLPGRPSPSGPPDAPAPPGPGQPSRPTPPPGAGSPPASPGPGAAEPPGEGAPGSDPLCGTVLCCN